MSLVNVERYLGARPQFDGRSVQEFAERGLFGRLFVEGDWSEFVDSLLGHLLEGLCAELTLPLDGVQLEFSLILKR